MNSTHAMKTVVLALVAAACVLALSSSAEAAIIDARVDFNDNVAAPAGWNLIADPSDTGTVHNLTDFNTGLATGVTLQVTDPFINSGGNYSVTWSNPYAPWVDASVLSDYGVLVGSDAAQVVLDGLDPADTYQIELLSVRGSGTSNTSFLVNGQAGTIVDGGGSTTAWNAQNDGYTNQDFMLWSAVSPDSSGQIVIDVSTGSNYAFLNGLRLYAVPEPSGFALCLGMFAGGVGLAPRSRRGRRRRDRVSCPSRPGHGGG